MILASFALQLAMNWVQNRKLGMMKMLREAFIIFIGVKPGVDAMRVLANVEMDRKQVVDSKIELVATKMCEIVCESIPGEDRTGHAKRHISDVNPIHVRSQAASCRSTRSRREHPWAADTARRRSPASSCLR
jgi:hypothetical protein